jgi:small subunit ribosomal protein S6
MATTTTMHTYEAMVLIDSGQENFEAACEPIRRSLDRNEAEVLAMKLWDDRRLAYEIKGRRRGTYVLVYFNMNPANVVELENDFKLDDKILRVLILRNEDVTDEVLKAETPATAPPREDEGDRRGGRGRRDERGDRDRDRKSEKPEASEDKSEKPEASEDKSEKPEASENKSEKPETSEDKSPDEDSDSKEGSDASDSGDDSDEKDSDEGDDSES